MEESGNANGNVLRLRCKLQGGNGWKGEVEVPGDATVLQLKQQLEQHTELPAFNMKLLAAGKYLEDSRRVADHKLRPNGWVLVMKKKNMRQEQKQAESEKEAQKLTAYRDAAKDFASRADSGAGVPFAEIVDQSGKPVELPEKDRRALIAGGVLHERGRSLLRDGKYEDAMRVLADAEREYQSVSPALLAIIDNYGYVCLDIAWAYFKQQRIEVLRNATEKLRSAEMSLQRAHGKNLDQLRGLRDGVVPPELVMYVRLHLLQAIVAFHQGYHVSACSYLKQAEDELRTLRVTDAEMAPLLDIGFSVMEARLGLRACQRDAEAAIAYILNRREQRQRKAEEAREFRRKRRKQKRLGPTADGGWVDLALWKMLREMGFSKYLAAEALKQTNNDYQRAVETLTDPDAAKMLERSNDGQQAQAENAFGAAGYDTRIATEPKIAALLEMGFSREQSIGTLLACRGDLQAAINKMIAGEAVEFQAPPPRVDGQDDNAGSSDDNSNSSSEPMDVAEEQPAQLSEEELKRLQKEREEAERRRALHQEAQQDLMGEIKEDEEAEFDLTLDEEAEVFAMYKKMLQQKGQWIGSA